MCNIFREEGLLLGQKARLQLMPSYIIYLYIKMNITEISVFDIAQVLIVAGVSYVVILMRPQPGWIIVLALASLSIVAALINAPLQGSMLAILKTNMDATVSLFALSLVAAAVQFTMLLQRFTFLETILILLFISLLSSPVAIYLTTKNQ